jgi:hypothetical protein
MRAAFDAILFDADGVVQTTDDKWFYAMTALIGNDDEDRVRRFLGDIMTAELPALAAPRSSVHWARCWPGGR